MARIIMTAKKGALSFAAIANTYADAIQQLMDAIDDHMNDTAGPEGYDADWDAMQDMGFLPWLLSKGYAFNAEPLI